MLDSNQVLCLLTSPILGKIFSEDNNNHINLELEKSVATLRDEINLITKGLINNTDYAFSSLNSQRVKHKSITIKLDKLHTDLEQSVSQKRKLDGDKNKNSFNTTLKDKNEDKILQYLSEIEEKTEELNKLGSDIKNLENFVNIIIESVLKNTLSFCLNSFISLRKSFVNISIKKVATFNLVKAIITQYWERVKELTFDLENIENVYAERFHLNNFRTLFLKFS